MAYTVPTAEDLKTRFPEFEPVSVELVTQVIGEASGQVSTRWREADYRPAIMLLAAHLLVSEGAVERATTGTSTMTTQGPVTRERVGDVEVSYGGTGSGQASASAGVGDYGSTEYGRRFLRLLRLNFAGPMVA